MIDADCGSGICLTYEKVCVPSSEVIYLSSTGVDTGSCTAAAPCASFGFALPQASSQRNYVRIMGTSFSVGAAAIGTTVSLVFDGSAAVTGTSGGPVLVPMSGVNTQVKVEGLTIEEPGAGSITVTTGSQWTLLGVHSGSVTLSGGSLAIEHSTISNTITSNNSTGQLTITDSEIDAPISTMSTFSMQRSRIASTASPLLTLGAPSTIINDVFSSSNASGLAIETTGSVTSSVVAFDTFVNQATTASTMDCLAGALTTSSSIFVWGPSLGPMCSATFSLFTTSPQSGTDISGQPSTFFVNLAGSDFHLAPGSPALRRAETGLSVTDDFDGNPRPNPSGSTPDIGAFESP
jgi:hypothetical protein